MAKTLAEIEADWRATMADPSGPSSVILGSRENVQHNFYINSKLTYDDIEELGRERTEAAWARSLWKKLKADGNSQAIVNAARLLAVGLDMGFLYLDTHTEEIIMHSESDDLTGLMWQVALTNWEGTKNDLTVAHLQTMVRIGLRNMENEVLHRSVHPETYSAQDAEKALAKVTLLVTELNERMRKLRARPALTEGDKS